MRRGWLLARVALAAAAVAAVLALLRGADGARLWALIAGRGPIMVLVLLPFLIGMAVDTVGWQAVLARLGRPLPYLSLLRIRLAAEGALLSLPGGAIAAEALKPMLLDRVHGVPVRDAAASLVVKKTLVVLSHGIYLGVGLLAGAGILHAAAPARAPALATAAVVGATICLVLGVGSVLALRRRPGWWRRSPRLARTAELAGGFFRGRPRTVLWCFGIFLLVWLVEALETFVIARLLGLRLTLGGALGFESLIALGRALGFVLPAGLGIQDVGHLLLARAVGSADATTAGAALIFTKRSKEAFWIVAGAVLLSSARRTGRLPDPGAAQSPDVLV
jgi:glycosyltransferase 2 family protein